MTWRKSTYCGPSNGCVEAGSMDCGCVAVRDSKDRSGPVLVLSAGAWRGLLATINSNGDRHGA